MNKTKKAQLLVPLMAAAILSSSPGKAKACPAAEPDITPLAQAVVLGAVQAAVAQAISSPLLSYGPATAVSAAFGAASVGYVAETRPATQPAK